MTLVTCPDCHRQISANAPSCPNCGRPIAPPSAYGQPQGNPYAQPRQNPYAETPANPYAQPQASPYAQPQANPYAQPSANPYAQPQANPYAQPQPANPYARHAARYRAPDVLEGEKQNVQIAYALYAGSYLLSPLIFAAVIFAYVKRGDARGSYLAEHYDWLIETFWQSLLGGIGAVVVGLMLMAVSEVLGAIALVGFVLFLVGWPIYRLIKGWTSLNAGRAPEAPSAAW